MRWLGWALLGVVSGVAGGVLAAKPLLGWFVRQQAAQAGVELAFERLEIQGKAIVLGGVTFRVSELGAEGSMPEAMLHVKHFLPERLHARAPRVRVVGSPAEVISSLVRWSKRGVALPAVEAEGVALSVTEPFQPNPWLDIREATLSPHTGGATLVLPSSRVAGVSLSPTSLVWASSGDGITVGVGASDPSAAKVRARISSSGPLRVLVTAERASLAPVAGWLGPSAAAFRKVSLDGSIEATLAADQTIDGKFQGTLSPYVPPHPAELKGLFTGNKTSFSASFRVPPGNLAATLPSIEVSTGKLALRGNGSVSPALKLQAQLNGAVPCTSVARSVAVAGLGSTLGGIVDGLAGGLLSGNVSVSLRVEADMKNPLAATVHPTLSPNCSVSIL